MSAHLNIENKMGLSNQLGLLEGLDSTILASDSGFTQLRPFLIGLTFAAASLLALSALGYDLSYPKK